MKDQILEEFKEIKSWKEKGYLFYRKYGLRLKDTEDELIAFIWVFGPLSSSTIIDVYGIEGEEVLKELKLKGVLIEDSELVFVP